VTLHSTGQVVDLLGVPTHRIEYLLRDRKIRPAKGPTGAFNWTSAEVLQAAAALGVLTPELEARLEGRREVRP
jgi:hypothetical protein